MIRRCIIQLVFALSCVAAWTVSATLGANAAATTGWSEHVLLTFDNGNGALPDGNLVRDRSGALYGTAMFGGSQASGSGTVFKLTPPATGRTTWGRTEIYTFHHGADGAFPMAGVIFGPNGVLYGTTWQGGVGCYPYGCGVVFALIPPAPGQIRWTFETLHSFSGLHGDGLSPVAALLRDANGVLYGTTTGGGDASCVSYAFSGCGTVYELIPPSRGRIAWTERILHRFTGRGSDGIVPLSELIADRSGNLFGTTLAGGGVGLKAGTAYELVAPHLGVPAWTESSLHSFSGLLDGSTLRSGLVAYRGRLYGTTYAGGPNCVPYGGCGVIFSLTPPRDGVGAWTETTVHAFDGLDGADSYSSLIVACDALEGTTNTGGIAGSTYGFGLVFRLAISATDPTGWSERVLYTFAGGPDGKFPVAGLVSDGEGRFFGAAQDGGTDLYYGGFGTVFEVVPERPGCPTR